MGQHVRTLQMQLQIDLHPSLDDSLGRTRKLAGQRHLARVRHGSRGFQYRLDVLLRIFGQSTDIKETPVSKVERHLCCRALARLFCSFPRKRREPRREGKREEGEKVVWRDADGERAIADDGGQPHERLLGRDCAVRG